MRTLLLWATLLLFFLPSLAFAQATTVAEVQYADGQKLLFEEKAGADVTDFLITFLRSEKDGKCTLTHPAEGEEETAPTMVMDKTAKKVVVSYPSDLKGETKTLTVDEAVAQVQTAQARNMVTACATNLKNIGTALEMYSMDNKGAYPESLSQLVPEILMVMPVCPTSKTDYSASYIHGAAGAESYALKCTGDHSAAGLVKGLPGYSSVMGLLTTPALLEEYYKP